MDDQELNQTPYEAPDSGFYETGATRPPKNYGGLLALLLTAGIVLTGILNAAGLLRPSSAESDGTEPDPSDVISFLSETTPAETIGETAPMKNLKNSSAKALELHESPASAENIPQSGGLSLQEIYEKNIDSVVSISCARSDAATSGSGVVLTQDGYLVTNAHVVENALSISVLLTDGRTFPASLVGADALSDLAVLRIDAEDLTPGEFGDSSVLRAGDAVVAIGDPLGISLRGTMTDGIVSAINRDITTGGRTMTLIQTNAALNSGNSGGPLINCYGQVIGINTMKMSSYVSDTPAEGLGFAIPSTTVKEIVDQLMRQGYISGRPDLGLDGEDVSPIYQYLYQLPAGLYVTAVDRDGSAAQAGLIEGDILLSLNGQRITGSESMQTVLYSLQVGDTVNVIFYRGGRQLSTDLILQQSAGNARK